MSAAPNEDPLFDDDLDEILDEVVSYTPKTKVVKGKAAPLKRTKRQIVAAEKKAAADALEAETAALKAADLAAAQRLAQIVNLHIAGVSLSEIGAQIGASADEVDRMLTQDAARYVRSQPALRTYVRNFISKKYTELLEVDWPIAVDTQHKDVLDFQDRSLKILKEMGRLHGAEAPTQAEIKMDATPEAVDRMVEALAAKAGRGYDDSIFDDDDIEEAEIIEDAIEASTEALEVSGNAVAEPQDDDEEWEK